MKCQVTGEEVTFLHLISIVCGLLFLQNGEKLCRHKAYYKKLKKCKHFQYSKADKIISKDGYGFKVIKFVTVK